MEAETQDGNFPKFVYYLSYELEQHYLFSTQMGIPHFQYKIGKLIEVVIDRVTAYFKPVDTDHIMTMSFVCWNNKEGSTLELFITEHWLAKKLLNNSALSLHLVMYLF